ncbi:MAG: DUF3842 family protein [Clostridia bacterium]
MKKTLVVVIDGMGGGIGKSIVGNLHNENIRLVALGTNDVATNNMLKAGAHEGYTGEENIVEYVKKADLIIGVMGILIPNSLLGEFSTEIVTSIFKSTAVKVLVPMNKCGIKIACEENILSYHIDYAIKISKDEIKNLNHEGL